MRTAYLYTLLVVAAWSFSQVANKALLLAERAGVRLTPLQVAFWPIAMGWISLLALLVARRRLGAIRRIPVRGWAVLAAMGLSGWVGHSVLRNLALKLLPLPDAITINYLHPVFVVMFQGALFGAAARRLSGWERPAGEQSRPNFGALAGAVVLCLLGVAMIATGGRVTTLGGIGSLAGAVAGVCGAFSWGVYSNLGRFVPMGKGTREEGSTDVQSFLAMTTGLVMMAGVLAGTGALAPPNGYYTQLHLGGPVPVRLAAWPLIVLHGAVVYCGSYTLWLYALAAGERAGDAHKLPLLTYLSPVLAILLGWLVLRESSGPGFWQGAALIAAGNAVNLWRGSKKRPPASE